MFYYDMQWIEIDIYKKNGNKTTGGKQCYFNYAPLLLFGNLI